MNMLYLLGKENVTLSTIEVKTKTEKNITISKGEQYKGYNGTYCWNEAFKKYEGKILGIKQTIVYEGENLHELNVNFQKAVDYYLQETAI